MLSGNGLSSNILTVRKGGRHVHTSHDSPCVTVSVTRETQRARAGGGGPGARKPGAAGPRREHTAGSHVCDIVQSILIAPLTLFKAFIWFYARNYGHKNRLEKKTRTRHARAAGRLQASHRLRAPPLKCEMPAGPPPSPHPQAQIEGLWVMHTSYCLLPVSLSLLVGARWAAVGYERARSSPRTSSPTSHLPPRAAREAGLQGGWGGGSRCTSVVPITTSFSRV